jgi:DNA-binding response OmpR family regulator
MPKTLLLADDSVTIQRVIELTFAHEDVRVVSVSDGRRAMQWMDTEWPDIVLVDVEVPEADGYEVASHVKTSTRLKNVPVLLLAGAFEPVDQERVQRIGCDGVLVKPFEPQQLVSRVKALLDRSARSPNGSGPMEQREIRRTDGEPGTVTPFPAGRVMTHAGEPEPLEPPTRPVWETSVAGPLSGTAAPAPPPATLDRTADSAQPRVSLASAFTALLAAEQSSQPAPAAAASAISEASVEDAVRRVLVRMTDELVRRIVLETAERLIKEEIEKIKATPE